MNLYLTTVIIIYYFHLNFLTHHIQGQSITFPGESSAPARPPPRPPPSSFCGRGSTCIVLGNCRHIINLIASDRNIIRRTACGRGPQGIQVCCPNAPFSPSTTTTRRPATRSTTRRPAVVTRPAIINFPGFGSPSATTTSRPATANTPQPTGSSLLPRPPNCGVTENEDRIFGGRPAPLGAYTWVAALGYTAQGSSRISFECAGAIINNRYVITAAHCLDPSELQGRILVVIHLGDWDLTSPTDCQASSGGLNPRCFGPHLEVGVEETIIHPDYSKRGANSDDIALVRIDVSVDFQETNRAPISPICIPEQNFDAKVAGRDRLFIAAGWGFTEHGNRSNVLLRVGLDLAEDSVCEARYRSRYVGNQLCIGGKAGFDTCSGDSGGPLILSGARGPPYVLAGIVSFGPIPCALANNPAVYTEVAKYRTWIEETLRP